MYHTKTGIILSVLKGDGLGDGIKRAKLRLCAPDELASYWNETLSVRLESAPYFGANYTEMVVTFQFETKLIPVLLSELCQIENFLCKRFNLGTIGNKNYGVDKRAKLGFKGVTYRFGILSQDATRLGFKGNYAERIELIRGKVG